MGHGGEVEYIRRLMFSRVSLGLRVLPCRLEHECMSLIFRGTFFTEHTFRR